MSGGGLDHELPWGWWLRAHGQQLEDEHGRLWSSVRQAFWQGRLGFPDMHFAPEQHELLLRTLSAMNGRWLASDENRHDLFGGDMLFWRFYVCWLASVGMLDVSRRSTALEAPLSSEGRSVMLMLHATREPEWERLPLAEVVAAVAYARDADEEERERTLTAFERETRVRRHMFARECIGSSHLLTLTSVAVDARMPTRRVAWSQAFTDPRRRDDLFAWMTQRVDCWDAWGELAYRKGADAFTSHLLTLVLASGALGAR